MIRGRERLMMNAFCHGDLGWKPVTIPEVMSVVMYWRTIMEADAVVRKSSTFLSLSMALEHLQPEKQKERSAIEPIIRTLSGFIHDGGDASNNDKLLNRERLQSRHFPTAPLSMQYRSILLLCRF